MRMEPFYPFEPVRSDAVPGGDQWIYQVKWDGVRMLAYGDNAQIRLFNRRKNERTMQYPELLRPTYCAASSFVLDGEIIALAEDGKPSFHEVMRRDRIRKSDHVARAMAEVPIVYMIFDVVHLNGSRICDEPLAKRIEALQTIITPGDHVQLVSSHEDGHALFAAVQQMGMEGIVCKDLNRTYAIGGKDNRWMKVKNYRDVIAVIGGFTLRDGVVNAVLAGLYRAGNLIFIGKVGTGKWTAADWRKLTVMLMADRCESRPFADWHPDMRGANWVKPRIAVKIKYSEWRKHEGRHLRHPSIQSIVDVPPAKCIWE